MASSDSKGFFFFANSLPPQIRAPLTLELDDSETDISSHATLSQSDYTSQEEQEEEFVEDDECVELSPMHAAPLRATPFAHLSTFTDEEEEEEEEAIRGDTLSLARVSGNTFGAPTIELMDSEEENHQPSIYVNSLPVNQSLLANDFESFSGSDDDKLYVDDEPGQGQVLGIRVACDEYSTSSATHSDVISQHSQNEQFGSSRVVFDELESVKLIEADGVEYYEDYNNSLVKEQDMSFNHLPELNSHVHCMAGEPVSEAFAENVEYSTPTQTTEANADGGVAADQVSDCENQVSIATSAVNSNAEFHDSSAGFESNYGVYEGNKTLSVESCELFYPTLLPECYLEKDLSKDVSLEDELFCDYDSHENVEKLDLGYTAKEEATVELNSACQESESESCASDGDAGLMSVAFEQFKEQISALSILLGSKGSGKDSQGIRFIRSSHGTVDLPKDNAKVRFIYADGDAESDGSSGTVTSADESSVICLEEVPDSFSSLPYSNARTGFQHSITKKEKEKIQKMQTISVKFLRLVQRLNLSIEDSLVSKVLCRLVADIERRLNQEFVIRSAKSLAKKLEANCPHDLDFSLNILVLGESGVGKSATINSIFGEMKVVTSAFEPATTSIKEVCGTIDGIKIRILDTPGLKSSMKEQAFNRKMLSSIERYIKKFPPDITLYVDRADLQTRDLNDLPILRSITNSLGPSIWQHAILALTHAASVPFDGPSGSPLSYEVFVAQKSYLVQQSIREAVHNLCELSPSFMCPVALVENHPLCGKNMSGDCVLPNGLRWRSQLLALCFSLKILSEVSSVSRPQTLFDHWKHFLFHDHSQPLCHVLLRAACSSSRSTNSIGLFYSRGISSVKVVSIPYVSYYCTYSRDNLCSSKRRSRGPVMAGKKASEGIKQEDGKYKHTVDLPKTTFGMRANSSVREPEIQKIWEENQVFKKVVEKNSGANFILHDGPPYANGDLHIGHALNKILKDIINRYKVLQNYKVYFIPGWDCHGLPIELKVLQSLDQKARSDLTPLKLRAKAAKFAKETVKKQMSSFKRYGVWADWNDPYLTLDPEYEAAQIEVFGQMALKGYIYRGRKPVHWSPSSRTALAEAELEYPEKHISRSIYAIFRVVSAPLTPSSLLQEFPNLCLAVWTTTPWTIPANAAVAVNPKLEYAVVEIKSLLEPDPASGGKNKKGRLGLVLEDEKKPFLIVASELVPSLEAKWGVKLVVKKKQLGSELENYRYIHPIDDKECPVVIGGDYITTETGTGLVHTAPGHGQEDYVTGQKYGLPIFSPVDDDGKFTEEAGQFSGLDVLGEGNTAVVKYLDEHLSLIMEESYEHKYPYDWRTKKPTIFRATEQWFASVEGFRHAAVDAINHVKWVPPQAENRISAMTSCRSDWCISRQRTWGVPIPVFYHLQSREPLMNEETIDHIKSIITQKGGDAWWYMTVEDLLPSKYRDKAAEYEKGTDTMDVWFDSGSSWAAVLGKRDSLSYPADLYLEGTDQHRGWFQSSLLTSVATKGKAPYSSVLTHGFVLDEKGLKMSKSLGNVVDPRFVIEGGKNQKEAPAYGADVLRLWVSSVDYTSDVMIGAQILRQMSEVYRKLRGTLRYLLANLHDWKTEYTVQYHELPRIDQHALFQLENVVKNIQGNYENYQFFKIFQILQRFVIVDLSNFYFDVAKDRLYVGGSTSYTRKSCQTVLAAHLLSIVRILAPILPHLAEDVWQNLPFQYITEAGSVAEYVFESRWPISNERWLALPAEEINFWENILELRTEVNRVLEVARTGKLIGSSLDAKVHIYTSEASLASQLRELCAAKNDSDRLHRLFITSQAEILPSLEDEHTVTIPYSGECLIQGKNKVWIGISRAVGSKCERCWNYSQQVGSFLDHPTLCSRCYGVVGLQTPPQVAAVS